MPILTLLERVLVVVSKIEQAIRVVCNKAGWLSLI